MTATQKGQQMTAALIKYEAARTALAEAHRIDEVKDIRDKAEAMAAYARQAKDSELIQYATEIKVRAERRCGEMLRMTAETGERATGGVTNLKQFPESNDATPVPTLADMGLTRDESSRYQKLAAMPEEHFETAVATAKATAGEVTTAHLLRYAKTATPPKRTASKQRTEEIRSLVQRGHNVEQIAAMQGVGVEYVRALMIRADIKVPLQKRGRSIDADRIVRESVSALTGIAQGLTLARDITVGIDEAFALLTDLRDAMKALRLLDTTLKEIINGK